MNKVFLTGVCGQEPTCFITKESNKSIAKFSIAVRNPNAEGGADWFYITTFNNIESFIKPFVHKGSKLAIVGHLTTSTFEKEGKKFTSMGVTAETVELTGTRKENENPSESSTPIIESTSEDSTGSIESIADEDLPF